MSPSLLHAHPATRRLRWWLLSLAVLLPLLLSPLFASQPVAAHPLAQRTTDTTGWFPFTQQGTDSSPTVISAAGLLLDNPTDDLAQLIDRRGFVRVDSNGHFVFANTGARVRFWGVNIGAASAYPASPDFPPRPGEAGTIDDAAQLAARLAKLGFNAVRLHHLDNVWSTAEGTIWEDYMDNTQTLSPIQLGRLDYLIYQLKLHGIYVNLNLNVGRLFTANDGVTAADALRNSKIYFNKNTTLFDPLQIALQQQYADTLLNHRNPYTGLAYKHDPVIFTTETTNENSFFLGLSQDELNWYADDPLSLPRFYDDELDGWSPLAGAPTLNRLANPDFATSLDNWYSYANSPAVATFMRDSGPTDNSKALRVNITQAGSQTWDIQFGQGQLAVQAGKTYEIHFAVRASRPGTIQLHVGRNAAPWENFGLAETIAVTTGWSTHDFTFTANTTSFGQARVAFDLGADGAANTLWFADLRFREAVVFPGWQGWLYQKYGSTAALAMAWAPADDITERQLLRNPSFEADLDGWMTPTFEQASALFTIDNSTASTGTHALRTQVTGVTDQSWHVQVTQGDLLVTQGQTYRFSFDAKASHNGPIEFSLQRGSAPWDGLGLYHVVNLTADWQHFETRFTASDSDAIAYIGFHLGQAVRTIWIDNVTLTPAPLIGLAPAEQLERNNIARPPRKDWASYTEQRVRDLVSFYVETEAAYFAEMQHYLKTVIGAQPLNTGTANYAENLAHLPAMAATDYIDNHYYWDHPWWPAGNSWGHTGWVIKNQSWLNSPFAGLFDKAVLAVKGKPFTLSEIDAVMPNRYEAEVPLLLATFANLQDWDGVFKYDYVDAQVNYRTEKGVGFFALAGNAAELGVMPVAARIFLAQQTAPAPNETALRFTPQEAIDSARLGWGGTLGGFLQDVKGVTPAAAFGSRLRIHSFTSNTSMAINPPTPAGPSYVSNGNQLTWDISEANRGRYLVNAPAVQGVMGFVQGKTFTLPALTLAINGKPTGARRNADFAAITLQSLSDQPLATSQQLLFSVVTRFENTGMRWNNDFTSVEDQWGRAPALIEPIRLVATVTVANPSNAKVWVLDAKGAPRSTLAYKVRNGNQLEFTVDTGRDKTLWYYVELPSPTGISGVVTDDNGAGLAQVTVQLYQLKGRKWAAAAKTKTDGNGAYRFAQLTPGETRLRFSRSGFRSEYFDNASTLALATPVTVRTGQITGPVNAQLERKRGAVTAGEELDLNDAPLTLTTTVADAAALAPHAELLISLYQLPAWQPQAAAAGATAGCVPPAQPVATSTTAAWAAEVWMGPATATAADQDAGTVHWPVTVGCWYAVVERSGYPATITPVISVTSVTTLPVTLTGDYASYLPLVQQAP